MNLLRDVESFFGSPDADEHDLSTARDVHDLIDVTCRGDLPVVEHVEGGPERGVESEGNDAHGAYFFACLKAL